jgi:type I restriction enzyme R subunit
VHSYLVSGFFTQDDLGRLSFLDRFNEPLTGAAVNTRIVDRAYQIEAIKTVAERIEASQRKFLLVLATGTGKTRVAITLVELLRRQKWIQRVLFLADRRELVKQALGAFKENLPDVPRAWIEGGEIHKEARIHTDDVRERDADRSRRTWRHRLGARVTVQCQ